jgi:hypothetical protein
MRLRGIDIRGVTFSAPVDLHIDLVYDDDPTDAVDTDFDRLMEEVFAPADFGAQFDYLDFLKRLLSSWEDILALLVKLGILDQAKLAAAEFNAQKFGDGSFLKLLIDYLPQIIDLLLKLGVLKPKEAAQILAGYRTSEFGDGTLLKLIGQFLLKILPLLLMLLKNETPSDISDRP